MRPPISLPASFVMSVHTGCSFPKLTVRSCEAGNPKFSRNCSAFLARSSPKAMLYSSDPARRRILPRSAYRFGYCFRISRSVFASGSRVLSASGRRVVFVVIEIHVLNPIQQALDSRLRRLIWHGRRVVFNSAHGRLGEYGVGAGVVWRLPAAGGAGGWATATCLWQPASKASSPTAAKALE